MSLKNVDYFMRLPYSFLIKPISDESGEYFYGKVLELDGCQSTGNSYEETLKNLKEAMEGYLETKLENGFDVPEPVQNKDYSGKFMIRVPKSLHQRLAFEAEKECVSLNQYVTYKLSK